MVRPATRSQIEYAKERWTPGQVGPTSQVELPAHISSPVTGLQQNFKVCGLRGFSEETAWTAFDISQQISFTLYIQQFFFFYMRSPA